MTYHENIILGAGPAGLQLAYFYEHVSRSDYLVLEKKSSAASFFSKYPLSSSLISINKRYTGPFVSEDDFAWRHDWNSLLTHREDSRFRSSDYFPSSKELYEYMNEYARIHELRIAYDTEIDQVEKDRADGCYTLSCKGVLLFRCKHLICATGMSQKNLPSIRTDVLDPIKHYADFSPSDFEGESLKKYENKTVLLVGGGNAAYELANILMNQCATVIILGSKKDLSIVSHYTGDLRSNYMAFHDSFFLKSLNGIDTLDRNRVHMVHIEQERDNLHPQYKKYQLLFQHTPYYNSPSLQYFDEIIFCTGWKWDNSLFRFPVESTPNGKFPLVDYRYQSAGNENLFFIGSLMHSHDYKVSSGGFIHGFRYLIRYFHETLLDKNRVHHYVFDGTMSCYERLAEHIQRRICFSADLYQMQSVMADLFHFDESLNAIVYIEGVTFAYAERMRLPCIHVLRLTYGEKEYDTRRLGDLRRLSPTFLHPEILILKPHGIKGTMTTYDRLVLQEDLVADFTGKGYYEKILRTLRSCLLIL